PNIGHVWRLLSQLKETRGKRRQDTRPSLFISPQSERYLIRLSDRRFRLGNQWPRRSLAGTTSVAAGPLSSFQRPDHAVARAIAALEVRRLRVPLREAVVPHSPAALRATRLVESEWTSCGTSGGRLDVNFVGRRLLLVLPLSSRSFTLFGAGLSPCIHDCGIFDR